MQEMEIGVPRTSIEPANLAASQHPCHQIKWCPETSVWTMGYLARC